MGVGTPEDLLDGVLRGVDMFDCVMPTESHVTEVFLLPTEEELLKTRNLKMILRRWLKVVSVMPVKIIQRHI